MNVSFNGFNENTVTFEANGTINVGAPVMITANGKVSAANGAFCGICTVVPYTNAPSVGFSKISAGSGKITADSTNGREFLVIDVDTTAKTAGIML